MDRATSVPTVKSGKASLRSPGGSSLMLRTARVRASTRPHWSLRSSVPLHGELLWYDFKQTSMVPPVHHKTPPISTASEKKGNTQ